MSKVAIEGNIAGSGTLTISAPNTNSNFTLSLPTNTGTIITQNSTPAFASTIGVGGATAAASGAGITFPATQSASSDANTLDDYEEGTWTPTATSGSGSITAYISTGSYTKVGRMVYLIGQVTLTTVGTAGGRLNISALPFTTANTTARPAVGVVREDAVTGVMYYGYLTTNNTTGVIATTADNSVVWTNNYNYSFCFTYQTS